MVQAAKKNVVNIDICHFYGFKSFYGPMSWILIIGTIKSTNRCKDMYKMFDVDIIKLIYAKKSLYLLLIFGLLHIEDAMNFEKIGNLFYLHII